MFGQLQPGLYPAKIISCDTRDLHTKFGEATIYNICAQVLEAPGQASGVKGKQIYGDVFLYEKSDGPNKRYFELLEALGLLPPKDLEGNFDLPVIPPAEFTGLKVFIFTNMRSWSSKTEMDDDGKPKVITRAQINSFVNWNAGMDEQSLTEETVVDNVEISDDPFV